MGDELRRTIEGALGEALVRVVPEITVEPDPAARTVAGTLFALMVESTLVDDDTLAALARRRAEDLAALLLPRRLTSGPRMADDGRWAVTWSDGLPSTLGRRPPRR